MRGFSSRNLKYMKVFAEECPELRIGQQAAAQLPWFHIVTLITKLRDPALRERAGFEGLATRWLLRRVIPRDRRYDEGDHAASRALGTAIATISRIGFGPWRLRSWSEVFAESQFYDTDFDSDATAWVAFALGRSGRSLALCQPAPGLSC